MTRQRFVVAISLWFLVALGVIVPLVWLINNRDRSAELMSARASRPFTA